MTESDYGTIMRCGKCNWRGPWYLLLPAVRYPGTARCPECRSERTGVDVEGRKRGGALMGEENHKAAMLKALEYWRETLDQNARLRSALQDIAIGSGERLLTQEEMRARAFDALHNDAAKA